MATAMAATNSFSPFTGVSLLSSLGLNSLSSPIATNIRISKATKRIAIPNIVIYTPCIVAITFPLDRALLKNVALCDGFPPGSAGVPSLFGLSPPPRRLVVEKAPNKLGTPTG